MVAATLERQMESTAEDTVMRADNEAEVVGEIGGVTRSKGKEKIFRMDHKVIVVWIKPIIFTIR